MKLKFLQLFVGLAVSLFFIVSTNAQSFCSGDEVFCEDFQDGLFPPDWLNYDLDGLFVSSNMGGTWNLDNFDAQIHSNWVVTDGKDAYFEDGANFSASAASWFDPVGCCADNWMITPPIAIDGDLPIVFLNYEWLLGQSDWPDGYRVLITSNADATTPEDFDDAVVLVDKCSGCEHTSGLICGDFLACCDEASEANDNGQDDASLCLALEWSSDQIDISDFVGETVRIAFHHNANDQTAIYIDNIRVEVPPPFELAVVGADVPYEYGIAPASFFPEIDFSATVQNNGLEEIVNARLALNIENLTSGEVYEDDGMAGAINLPAGFSGSLNNGTMYSFVDTGSYRIITTALSDSDDENVNNNVDTIYYGIDDDECGRDVLLFGVEENTTALTTISYAPDANGDAQVVEWGYIGHYYVIPETRDVSGAFFAIGDAFDTDLNFAIELCDTTGANGDPTMYSIVASTGNLGGAGIAPADAGFVTGYNVNFECVTEMEAAKPYLLRAMQYEAGTIDLVHAGDYADTGTIELETDQGSFSFTMQPVIRLNFGEATEITEVVFDTQISSLNVDFAGAALGGACSYSWDFGDDTTGEGAVVSHLYSAEGSYEVCMTAINDLNEMTICETVDVSCALSIDYTSTPSTISLNIMNAAPNYTIEWDGLSDTGETLENLSPETEYTVTVTDESGCSDTQTIMTATCTLSIDDIQINEAAGLANVIISGSDGAPTYVWDLDGTTEDTGTTNFISGLDNGNYSVTVTDQAGCSETLAFSVGTSIEELTQITAFNLYPTIAQQTINIEASFEQAYNTSISILTIEGKQIVSVFENAQLNTVRETVDVSNLPNGIYILELEIDGIVKGERFVINR